MYKWGFFILLGVNVYLVANSFVPKFDVPKINIITETIREKESLAALVPDGIRKVNVISSAESEEMNDSRITTLQSSYLDKQLRYIKVRFDYFFNHNDLHEEDLREVEICMLQRQNVNFGCCGDGLDAHRNKLLELIAFNTNRNVAEKVINMMEKQNVYYEISSTLPESVQLPNNIVSLVDEMYALQSEYLFVSGFGIDPFAQLDEVEDIEEEGLDLVEDFDEALDLESVLDESEQIIEQTMTLEEKILDIYKDLGKNRVKYFEEVLKIHEKYMLVSSEQKLNMLRVVIE